MGLESGAHRPAPSVTAAPVEPGTGHRGVDGPTRARPQKMDSARSQSPEPDVFSPNGPLPAGAAAPENPPFGVIPMDRREREILEAIADPSHLRWSLRCAIRERRQSDWLYDPLELSWAESHPAATLETVRLRLQSHDREPVRAYTYAVPKDSLCDRRMFDLSIVDLAVRYAIVGRLAQYCDSRLSKACFANRLARGEDAKNLFLEPYANGGWKRFCQWQQAAADRHPAMLRTDLSGFFDTVDQGQMVEIMLEFQGIAPGGPLDALYRWMFALRLIPMGGGRPEQARTMGHGIPTGPNPDSFLSNLYLADLDQEMAEQAGLEYGRYCDDMVLFGPTVEVLRGALRRLQGRVFDRGLRLNTSKTELAQGRVKIRQVITSLQASGLVIGPFADDLMELTGMLGGNVVPAPHPVRRAEDVLAENAPQKPKSDWALNQDLSEVTRRFEPTFQFDTDPAGALQEAKDFCKFLGLDAEQDESGKVVTGLSIRTPQHVDRLSEIFVQWRSATRHAAWLLVQTATYTGVPMATQRAARQTLMHLLESAAVPPYARYRLIHHLARWRVSQYPGPAVWNYLTKFHPADRETLRSVAHQYLGEETVELQLAGALLARGLGESPETIAGHLRAHLQRNTDDGESGPAYATALLERMERWVGQDGWCAPDAPMAFADEGARTESVVGEVGYGAG